MDKTKSTEIAIAAAALNRMLEFGRSKYPDCLSIIIPARVLAGWVSVRHSHKGNPCLPQAAALVWQRHNLTYRRRRWMQTQPTFRKLDLGIWISGICLLK